MNEYVGGEEDETMDGDTNPFPAHAVHEEEWSEIQRRRDYIYQRTSAQTQSVNGSDEDAPSERNLIGLAFSGGGIRSATFNLGLLQGLAELGILPLFDYLSTVSGGGYIGCWLASWIKREGELASVENQLQPKRRETTVGDEDAEPEAIFHLRAYSNYLAPRTGLFSSDSWALIGSYVRNLVANLLILIPSVFVVLTIFRAILELYRLVIQDCPPSQLSFGPWFVALPLVLAAVCLLFLFPAQEQASDLSQSRNSKQRKGAEARTAVQNRTKLRNYVFGLFLLYLTIVYLTLVPAFASTLKSFLGFIHLSCEWQSRISMIFTPTLLAIAVATFLFLVGAARSRYLDSQTPEFHSRVTGALLLSTLSWVVVTSTVACGPILMDSLPGLKSKLLASLGWGTATLFSVLKGYSKSNGLNDRSWLKVVTLLGPPIFLCGLIIVSAKILESLILSDQPQSSSVIVWSNLGLIFIVSLIFALLFGILVDINHCSLNEMYRNRLIRCYFGAPRNKWKSRGRESKHNERPRDPDPITGFDKQDDLPLACFRIGQPTLLHQDREVRDGNSEWHNSYWGPYPLINTAINLIRGDELAYQERRADSFLLSPLFCGSHDVGYQKTQHYGQSIDDLTLGRAMAISGAAANPNMGYHSSPMLTALMTVFNARLGWWFANPKYPVAWQRGEPWFGFKYLFLELLGWTNSQTSFVNLSDGGHFENLGVYELIRRRCRYIVVSDASADPNSDFTDLGNLIRKCKTDFGISIEINVDQLKPQGDDRHSKWHCAIGVIRYDMVDPTAIVGTLVYVKPSLTGDEPTDVKEYRGAHRAFPQESTSDQFFGEAQFESYRALGHHVAESVFKEDARELKLELFRHRSAANRRDQDPQAGHRQNIPSTTSTHRYLSSQLFAGLQRRWTTPPPALNSEFLSTVDSYVGLLKYLQDNPKLKRFREVLYPEVPDENARERDELQATSYLLQVMENAWLTLSFDQFHNHPLNSGWKNVLNRWSRSPIVRKYWPMLRSEYSRGFVLFCEEQLRIQMALSIHPLCGEVDTDHQFQQLVKEYAQEWPSELANNKNRGLTDFLVASHALRRELSSAGGKTPKQLAWKLHLKAESIPKGAKCDEFHQEIEQYGYDAGVAILVDATPGKSPPSPVSQTQLQPSTNGGSATNREYELLVWIRPSYRSQNLGYEMLKRVLAEIHESKDILGPNFRIHVRCPRSAWRGTGGGMAKQSWFMLFIDSGFRRPADQDPLWDIIPSEYEVVVLTRSMLSAYVSSGV